MKFSFLSQKSFNILWALISLSVALGVVGWFLASAVRAETGLTIDVTRKGNLLMAEAMTVEGSEVLDDSWRWMQSTECEVEMFTDDTEGSEGWTIVLDAQSGGQDYCFYVEDSEGREAAAGVKVAYPIIRLKQSNDQLVARASNAEAENILVDEDTWQWFRYDHIDGSRFGCLPQHFNLEEEGLKMAADASEEQQKQDFGEVKVAVYAAQKEVYKSGEGAVVNLTAEDQGLTYCFRVSDNAGITNSKHQLVSEVKLGASSDDSEVGEEKGLLSNGDESAGDTTGTTGNEIGEVGVDDDGGTSVAGDQSNGNGDGDGDGASVWIRNIGFTLLGVAVIGGIYMLIRSSKLKDNELQE